VEDQDKRERDRLSRRHGPDIATEPGALALRCGDRDQIDGDGIVFGEDDEKPFYIVSIVRPVVRDLQLEAHGLLGAHVRRDVGHESEIGGLERRADRGGEAPGVVARESVLRRRANAHGETCLPDPQIALEGDGGGSVRGDKRDRADNHLLIFVSRSAIVERRLGYVVGSDEPSV
jgi:hypothetical protein